jgi:hypothetical protein
MYSNPGNPFNDQAMSPMSPRPASSIYSQGSRSPTPTIRPQPLTSVQSLQSLDRWLDKLLDTLAERYAERQVLKRTWTASEDNIRELKYQLFISRGMRISIQGLLDQEKQRFAGLETRMRELRDDLDDLLAVFWRLLEERSRGKVSPVEKVCGLVQALSVEELEVVKEVVQERIYRKGNFI